MFFLLGLVYIGLSCAGATRGGRVVEITSGIHVPRTKAGVPGRTSIVCGSGDEIR